MKGLVLDSYSLIVFLEKEKGYEAVVDLFEKSIEQERDIYLCIVNWGEVIYHFLHAGGESAANIAQEAITALPIRIIDADKELSLTAARIKAANKLSYADAFAAALAKLKKAELVTGDREFKQVEGEVKVYWI
jgi:predicted nucleic acid-binding protein